MNLPAHIAGVSVWRYTKLRGGDVVGQQRATGREITMSLTNTAFILRAGGAALLICLGSAGIATAEIRINTSRYEDGTLTVAGSTEPNRIVTLDGRASLKSDPDGHFVFHEHYKPETCMSDIKSGPDIYSAVIAGCYGEFAIERQQPGWKNP
jgi:hypothetical protein